MERIGFNFKVPGNWWRDRRSRDVFDSIGQGLYQSAQDSSQSIRYLINYLLSTSLYRAVPKESIRNNKILKSTLSTVEINHRSICTKRSRRDHIQSSLL